MNMICSVIQKKKKTLIMVRDESVIPRFESWMTDGLASSVKLVVIVEFNHVKCIAGCTL